MIDGQERRSAAEIEQSHPGWVVIWGCYSRLFWAFPRFQVPEGTIVSAPRSSHVLADMHRVEVEAGVSAPVASRPTPPSVPSPRGPAPLQGLAAAQATRIELPLAATRAGALDAAAQLALSRRHAPPSRTSHAPYVSGPDLPVRDDPSPYYDDYDDYDDPGRGGAGPYLS